MNFNNIINYSFLIVILTIFTSCSKEKNLIDELNGLQQVTTITNKTHKIDFYTNNGKFQTGYNSIYFQIKNLDGSTVDNASAYWMPIMQMMGLSHTCPSSTIAKKNNSQSIYEGYIVFQMAENSNESWELSLFYTIDGVEYNAKNKIIVTEATKRLVETFMGNDGINYVLAFAGPSNPKVAINDMKAVLYKMESPMNFVTVDHYKIIIDPRMPGMANHSSPNNLDLVQGVNTFYEGKLSLTMTGYWKINLQVQDAAQQIIKGEPVTQLNESSSIYFELEF